MVSHLVGDDIYCSNLVRCFSACSGGVLYSRESTINKAGKRIPGLKEFSADDVRGHDNIR